jgi:ketosteroid isomerase-like protein
MARSSLTALFTLLLTVLLVVSASAQEWSAAQQEVWSLEEAYWERRQRGDVEGFMNLWDEDFVGWPYWAPEPMTKVDIQQSVREGALSGLVGYELIPQAIRLFGDIAIVHYAYELQGRDAEGREASRVGRLTHTWRRLAGKWRIIGGMSSPHSG